MFSHPHRFVALCAAGVVGLLALVSCGGGGSSQPTPTPTTTQPPARAAMSARGNGPIVIHPSADPAFVFAFALPLLIEETGGGVADWNFVRMSLFLNGVEIERSEIGADIIANAGLGRWNAGSSEDVTVILRFNNSDFDGITLTLGFSDVNHGGQFTAAVPFNTFTDVQVSQTPALLPAPGVTKP